MKCLAIKLFVFVAIMLAAVTASASFSELVTVNTSSLDLTSGYIYFDFTPDPNNTVAATAQIVNFNGGTLGAQDTVDVVNGSAVSGTLPGTVTFKNTNPTNDYLQAINFGNQISFQLNLSQTENDPYYTTTFSMWLSQDALGNNPLLTSTGELFSVDLNGNVSIDASEANVASTPLPPSALMFGASLFGLFGIDRRKQR